MAAARKHIGLVTLNEMLILMQSFVCTCVWSHTLHLPVHIGDINRDVKSYEEKYTCNIDSFNKMMFIVGFIMLHTVFIFVTVTHQRAFCLVQNKTACPSGLRRSES